MLLISLLLAVSAPCIAEYAAPVELVRLNSDMVDESSGLVQSHADPTVFRTHNDSGDVARIYAFNLQGRMLGASMIIGASATDWEDMAMGPCPVTEGYCLYLADIGDNAEARDHVTIYAVPEPRPGRAARVEWSWNVKYPDGPHNAETLLVQPRTGDIFVVTKSSDGLSQIFQVNAPAGADQTLMRRVAEIDLATWSNSDVLVTGGAWSPDGSRLALRTYGTILEWITDPYDPTSHWDCPPEVFDAPDEAQGESITYSRRGDLYTTSEGAPMVLSLMRRVE